MDGVFLAFLGSLTSLVICMVVGFICRKMSIFSDNLINGMTTLLLKVTLPCTVFISMLRPFSKTLMAESIATFFLSGAVFLFGGLLAFLLARFMKASMSEGKVWQFALIFANVGYMGFPVCMAVFGEESLIYTSMANVSFTLLLFTVGIRLYNPAKENKSNWKLIALNPALIAAAVGFAFFLTQLRFPWPVTDAIAMLGAMTSPISMLLVGSIIAKGRLRDLLDLRILPVTALRLLAVPACAFFLLRSFIHNPLMLGVIVVLSAMPAGAITAIFAEEYKGDTVLASKIVVVSTLLCVVTVPLISLLLG
jgi:hypothetical protein